MGKASSAKKVAKAARAGGRGSGVRQRNLLFPGIIGAVVILGVALIVFAREDYQDKVFDDEPLVGQTHWHAGFGVYICGEGAAPGGEGAENTEGGEDNLGFIPVTDEFDSQLGIHSHGDEVIHIHPTSRNAAGENAQLGVYIDESPLIEVSDDEITVGDRSWKEGEDTCNGEDAEVIVAQWTADSVAEGGDPAIITSGFKDLRFREDLEAYVVAFVPAGDREIPLPRSMGQASEASGSQGGLSREDVLNDPSQMPDINPEDLPEGVNPEDLFPEGSVPEGSETGEEAPEDSGSEGSDGQSSEEDTDTAGEGSGDGASDTEG